MAEPVDVRSKSFSFFLLKKQKYTLKLQGKKGGGGRGLEPWRGDVESCDIMYCHPVFSAGKSHQAHLLLVSVWLGLQILSAFTMLAEQRHNINSTVLAGGESLKVVRRTGY